jgi:serine/threonine protein kinase
VPAPVRGAQAHRAAISDGRICWLMALSPGSRLGPYEILAPIGAGGMGEVYRAKDSRLGREVAIKVLPASFSADADRLRRFEQEAKAAGILNHPNLTAVHDIGTHEGAPYVVQELLEGETLRSALAGGKLSTRRAIDYSVQIVHGLAAAHEKGIVHRDLKPENIFVTNDGRVKILDFGLAKLTLVEDKSQVTNLPTEAAGTEPGVVLGTLGYMSPEQVRGKPADARSDIFSFGAILYEMLSGRRAFHGDSAADTMSAILKEDPPDLSVTNQSVPPGLDRIVRHSLEKSPGQRFHSAHDVAFALEALSDQSGAAPALSVRSRSRLTPLQSWLAGALLGGLLVGGLVFAMLHRTSAAPPSYNQLTFRKGTIWSARFGSDGKSVLYSAAWEGNPIDIFVSSPGTPESRSFGLPGSDLLAVSAAGDVAAGLESRVQGEFVRGATLARVSATGGGAPRPVLEDVQFADWSPDGKELAVARAEGFRTRLEFPIGKALLETGGWIGSPRVSPKGDRVAFIDHPAFGDDGGSVAVVDLAGKKTTISAVFGSIQGLAWSPDASEIWFTAGVANRALRAASLSGRQRIVASVTGSLSLQDISKDGRLLMVDEQRRLGLAGLAPGEKKERDLSWLDWSRPVGLSADGRTVLFYESGAGGGPGYSAYVRGTDGSPAVRLGEGQAVALSPDGKLALALLDKLTNPHCLLYPTGAGQPRPFSLGSLGAGARAARFFPDSRRLLVLAGPQEGPLRVYVTDVDGSKPQPVTPEGFLGLSLSLDGARLLARSRDGKTWLFALQGGEPTPVPELAADDFVVGWMSEGRGLYVQRHGDTVPARIDRFDFATRRFETWKEIMPADGAGVLRISSMIVSPDGGVYVYAYSRVLSSLYLVEGLK